MAVRMGNLRSESSLQSGMGRFNLILWHTHYINAQTDPLFKPVDNLQLSPRLGLIPLISSQFET